MKHSIHITLSLVVFLCALNFAGFSQDTTIHTEPVPIVLKEPKLNEPKQSFSKSKPFRLPKEKNPRVATWLSVALPGAGQIYNGQWYKVPIIYGGAAALIYFHKINKNELGIYQTEYRGRLSGDTINFIRNPDLRLYDNNNLRSLRDYYQRNIELIYVLSGLLYILNIVDACVFAHLSTFDVSDNLSMRIQPFASPDLSNHALTNQQLPMQGGIKFTFTLK